MWYLLNFSFQFLNHQNTHPNTHFAHFHFMIIFGEIRCWRHPPPAKELVPLWRILDRPLKFLHYRHLRLQKIILKFSSKTIICRSPLHFGGKKPKAITKVTLTSHQLDQLVGFLDDALDLHHTRTHPPPTHTHYNTSSTLTPPPITLASGRLVFYWNVFCFVNSFIICSILDPPLSYKDHLVRFLVPRHDPGRLLVVFNPRIIHSSLNALIQCKSARCRPLPHLVVQL